MSPTIMKIKKEIKADFQKNGYETVNTIEFR
jgi:hypothetical protein